MDAPQIPPVPVVIRQRTSGLAITSFVLSLVFCLPFIGPILAIVFGVIALRETKRRPLELTGRGLALAGLVISGVALLATVWLVCASVKTYRHVDPMVENLVHSIDDGDYESAMRDFDPRLSKALPLEGMTTLGDAIRERLGSCEARHWGFTYQWTKNPGEPATLTIAYRCRYGKTSDSVYVRVTFIKRDMDYKIGGLWFNASELDGLKLKKETEAQPRRRRSTAEQESTD